MAVPLEMHLEQITDRPLQLQALLAKWNWHELSKEEKGGFYLGLISLEVAENQYLNLNNEVSPLNYRGLQSQDTGFTDQCYRALLH